MTTLKEFINELGKLNKNKLIEIIYNKQVPESISISDKIRNNINFWPGAYLDNDNSNVIESNNSETNINFLKLESELEITRTKLNAANQTLENLQTIVDYHNEIIAMHKSGATGNKNSTTEGVRGVAVRKDISNFKEKQT
ncbi:hypothetical protein WA026_015716 [Henosepilachna vigintioctopunctata]|uniref:Uncharacterized protein n=1 Tax=Henosepilachna vigintioctopunctata TaxID=420089 RepID=A0AAW1URT7_9CUCU